MPVCFFALASQSLNAVANEFSGKESAAFRQLDESKTVLGLSLVAYLTDLEGGALLKRVCAR